MNSPSSSSSSSSPHARVIVLGAAALDLLAPRGGGGGASSSDDASMMMRSNTVKDAFFAFPILVFPAKENASKSCARKRAVEKLFRCALDGVQRALSRKKRQWQQRRSRWWWCELFGRRARFARRRSRARVADSLENGPLARRVVGERSGRGRRVCRENIQSDGARVDESANESVWRKWWWIQRRERRRGWEVGEV